MLTELLPSGNECNDMPGHLKNLSLMFESKAPTTLLDVPNELLLQILTNGTVTARDLYRLAIVCRRLHSLTLPLFLASHGIMKPSWFSSVYILDWARSIPPLNDPVHIHCPEPDALAGLAIDFDLKSIKYLRCYFQDPDGGSSQPDARALPTQQAAHLPFAVRRMEAFIRRMQSVDIVEISLVWDPYYVAQAQTRLQFAGAAYSSISEIRAWATSFAGLLNAAMEKGCIHLKVEYDAAIEAPFKFKGMGRVVKKALAFITQNVHVWRKDESSAAKSAALVPVLQWEWVRPLHESLQKATTVVNSIEPAVLSSSAREIPTLSSLSIHSPVLLLPPFTNWTLSVLYTQTSLTSLSFAYISISAELWRLLLPLIADAVSGRLVTLEVQRNCPNLDAVDLLRFLAKLPLLTKLVVDRSFRSRFQVIRPPSALFSPPSPTTNDSKARGAFTGKPLPRFNVHNLPLLFFANLHTLQAPVELVSLLLDARSVDNGPLPELKSLTVYPSSLLMHPPSYVESTLVVNALHRLVMESRPQPPSLETSTPDDAAIDHDRIHIEPVPVLEPRYKSKSNPTLKLKMKSTWPTVPTTLKYTLNAEMEFVDCASVSQYLKTLSARQEFQRTLWDALSGQEIEKLAGLVGSTNESRTSSTSLRIPNKPPIAFLYVTHLVLHKFNFHSGPKDGVVGHHHHHHHHHRRSSSNTTDPGAIALCEYLNLLFPSLRCLKFAAVALHKDAGPLVQSDSHAAGHTEGTALEREDEDRRLTGLAGLLRERCPRVKELIVGEDNLIL